MTDATIIAIVTIICGAVVTVVQLLTRSEVINLRACVEEQTIELAGLHQTIIAQSARIYEQDAQKSVLGRKEHKPPAYEPYEAMPPYRPPDATK